MEDEIQSGGFWKINNQGNEYGGDLYINSKKGIIYLELHIPNKGAPLSYLYLPYTIKFITGTMTNGAKATLIYCRRCKTYSYIGTEEVLGYAARFYIYGYSFDNENKIVFSQVSFTLSNILKWGNVSVYDMNFIKGRNYFKTRT